MTSTTNTIGRSTRVLGLAALIALLAGCATGGYGPAAGYPGQSQGYPGQYPGQQYPHDGYGQQSLTGTVENLDLNRQRLILVAQSAYGGGSRVELFVDRNTRLFFQGQEHSVQGLERGDVIRVQTAQQAGRLYARSIEVVRDVRAGQGGSQYGNELRGSIGYVDQRARVIELDGGGHGSSYGGSRARVGYDDRTVVEYQGRRYRPQDLERGDLVNIQARQVGNNEWLAERILVERSARSR